MGLRGELMKVWITKYALTDGIIEADAELCGLDIISASWDNGTKCGNFGSEEWCGRKKSAVKKAEEMRQKKITSMKKQIEKLERMRFE